MGSKLLSTGRFPLFAWTVVLVIGGLMLPGAKAASALSDSELALISGAGVTGNPQNPTVPQQPQQPQDDQLPQQTDEDSTATPPSPSLSNPDGMQDAPQVFTLLQGSAEVDISRRLDLQDDAQRGASLLNMENVIGSDAVAANNLFQGGALALEGTTTSVEVNQINDLAQLHRSQGSLQSSESGYYYESTRYLVDYSENWDRYDYLAIQLNDQHSVSQWTGNSWSVAVDPINFSEPQVNDNSIVTLIDPDQVFLIPPIGIDGTATGLFGEEYGADAYYSGLYVEGPRLSIDSLHPYGINNEDLLVASTARMGLIDFGGLDIRVCFGAFGCTGEVDGETDINLGQIEILNLFDALALLDPLVAPNDGIGFISDGIVLEGMGSVYEDDHNLNTGFALVGSGQFSVTEPASFYSGLDIDLTVESRVTLTFDLGDLDPLNVFPSLDESIPPEGFKWIDVSEHVPLIDIKGETINQVVSGMVIVPLGPGEVTAEATGPTSQTDSSSDVQSITESVTDNLSQTSFTETYEHQLLVGGQMSDAQAELLSLSEGSLKVDNNNAISLSRQTQQNIRVFNGVNAVSSVAANAVNVGQLPTMSRNTGGLSTMSMRQQNQFIQQR